MGREVRRVPPDWKHPLDERGHARALLDSPFDEAMDDWNAQRAEWNAPGNTERADYEAKVGHSVPYEEWGGGPPDPESHRPAWPEGATTAFQVYENVSEGTPVSPVFATREALIDWLVNDGSGMGIGGTRSPLSRRAAERFVDAGYAPSMVMTVGGPNPGICNGAQMYERDPEGR